MSARGDARRQSLVRAAASLLGSGGPAALSARAVAGEAGVPLAAVSYYFDGVDAMVREAAERLFARYLDQAAALVHDGSGGAWQETLVRVWFDPSPDGPEAARVRGTLAQVLGAASTPALAPSLRRWDAALVREVEHVLREAGRDVSRTRVLLAALDGAALARLGGIDVATGEQAVCGSLLAGLVADLRSVVDDLAPVVHGPGPVTGGRAATAVDEPCGSSRPSDGRGGRCA